MLFQYFHIKPICMFLFIQQIDMQRMPLPWPPFSKLNIQFTVSDIHSCSWAGNLNIEHVTLQFVSTFIKTTSVLHTSVLFSIIHLVALSHSFPQR